MIAAVDRRPLHPRPLRPISPRHALILAAILGGAVLQHTLVTLPLEPAPAAPLSAAPRQTASYAPAGTGAASGQGTTAGGAQTAHPALPARAALPARRSTAPVTAVTGARLQAPAVPVVAPQPAAPQSVSSQPATPRSQPATPADAALSASVWRAFNAYALPYQADSALIVEMGRQFGIDPAVPAALFMHEDGNINNRAEFPDHYNWLLYHTRNPGNIKCMYEPCYDGFQVYPTYRAGILDWFRLYDHYYYDLGIHDLARFVVTYCPPNVDGNGPPTVYQSDVMVKAARIRAGW